MIKAMHQASSALSECVSQTEEVSTDAESVMTPEVRAFLEAEMLDDRRDKARRITSDIIAALRGNKSVPHYCLGMNRLHWAVVAGDIEALKEITRYTPHDKFVELINQQNTVKPMNNFSFMRFDKDCPLFNKNTPLGISLLLDNQLKQDEGITRFLISKLKEGEVRNSMNDSDDSLLDLAVRGSFFLQVKELASLLGKYVNHELFNRKNQSGCNTLLHQAGSPGMFECLAEFTDAGQSLRIKDSDGNMPCEKITERVFQITTRMEQLKGDEFEGPEWTQLKEDKEAWCRIQEKYYPGYRFRSEADYAALLPGQSCTEKLISPTLLWKVSGI